MKRITIFTFFLCIMLVMSSCDTAMNDDTGSSADNSESGDDSMPGINDILPSDTNDPDDSGDTADRDNSDDNNPPDGTSPAGSPDSSVSTGNMRGLGDTVAQVMERIEGIIAVTQNYFKDSRETDESTSDRLTLAQARCSALADAHLSDDEVRFEREELMTEDDKEYFAFEFTGDGIKYYYSVDAYTGEIIDKNTEECS